MPRLDSCHTRLASAEQHRPRRGDDGVGGHTLSVATSPFFSSSPRRRFVTMVAVSETASSFTTASLCLRFVSIVGVSVATYTFFLHILAPAVLFVRFQACHPPASEGHDLAALTCMAVEIAERARCEPKDNWIGTCLNLKKFIVFSHVFELLTTLTFGALRKKKTSCQQHLRPSQKQKSHKTERKKNTLSTCGQQCFMNCPEHTSTRSHVYVKKQTRSVTVNKLHRREFISVTV